VPVLLYDGHCPLCRRAAVRFARLGGADVRLESFQEPGVLERYPDLSREQCMREMQLVHDDGRVEGGADAVRTILARAPAFRWLAVLLGAPGLRSLSRRGYGAIARNRYRLFGASCPEGTCDLHGRVPGPARALEGDYRPTARLFLRALGIVYLLAFASLAVQTHVLIGSDGLLPVREFLAARAGDGPWRVLRIPTLFWLWDGDAAVRGGAIVGLGLAIGLIAGFARTFCLIGLWLLFLSYVTAGRDFFWFQWDTLLLESTALALLLPMRSATPPHPIVVFLFRWLVFRLLFESGLAKVQGGGQSWFPLTAMAYYYETAPLPSLLGWYAHQLPLWAHRWTSALTLLGELLAPLFVWGGRPARRIVFAVMLAFQVSIQATANYGYFNVLSLAIALFLLDGRDLAWRPAWWRRGAPAPVAAASRVRPVARLAVAVAGGALFLLTLLELMVLLAGSGVAASPALISIRNAVLPYRVAGKYHLFAHIDPRRVEAEIEWSPDGQTWRAYEFHYKPGPLDRPPPAVAPHQPRVDFQLWFFTMGRDGGAHEYFNNLVRRLCAGSPGVQGLFRPESLSAAPPVAVRVAYHHYRMTDRATLTHEGRYWSRRLLDYHPVAHFCDSREPPRF